MFALKPATIVTFRGTVFMGTSSALTFETFCLKHIYLLYIFAPQTATYEEQDNWIQPTGPNNVMVDQLELLKGR